MIAIPISSLKPLIVSHCFGDLACSLTVSVQSHCSAAAGGCGKKAWINPTVQHLHSTKQQVERKKEKQNQKHMSDCQQISVFQKDDKPELLIRKIGCWTTTAQGFNTFIQLIMINVLTCTNILSCMKPCFRLICYHMSKNAKTSQVKYMLKNSSSSIVCFAPFWSPRLVYTV